MNYSRSLATKNKKKNKKTTAYFKVHYSQKIASAYIMPRCVIKFCANRKNSLVLDGLSYEFASFADFHYNLKDIRLQKSEFSPIFPADVFILFWQYFGHGYLSFLFMDTTVIKNFREHFYDFLIPWSSLHRKDF